MQNVPNGAGNTAGKRLTPSTPVKPNSGCCA